MNHRKSVFRVLAASIFALCTVMVVYAANSHGKRNEMATYRSERYRISFQYPANWTPNPRYTSRYEGEDGFFQVSAIDGEGMTIDQVTELDAFHQLHPYGSSPQIKELLIQGQSARLILPSDDQPEEMANQAGLIVKYPKPIMINLHTYYYLIVWADRYHIEQIAETIAFLS